ncbi:MAG: hypothetical protein ABSG82_02035 [Sedimentisphaerales bacterium]|jgi:hypothetical protein
MKSYLKLLTSVTACILIACLYIGCTATQKDTPQAQPNPSSQNASPASVPAVKGDVKQSGLSYGMVTSRVQKGVTTQAELIDLFGGPNIATTDSDGLETWVYERTSSQSEISQEGSQDVNASSKINRLGVFFGIGTSNEETSKSDTRVKSASTTSVTHSIKTLTVVVKFNKDKTVRDYSVRTANF